MRSKKILQGFNNTQIYLPWQDLVSSQIEDAKTLAACSDGIVIGSSIVEMIDEESSTKEFGRISKYLREMKTAIS